MNAISTNKIFGTCSCVLSLLHSFPLPNKFYQRQHRQLFPVLFLVTLLFRGICFSTGLISHSLSYRTGFNSYLVTLIISTPLSQNHTLTAFLTNISAHTTTVWPLTQLLIYKELNRLPNCTSFPHYLNLTCYHDSPYSLNLWIIMLSHIREQSHEKKLSCSESVYTL